MTLGMCEITVLYFLRSVVHWEWFAGGGRPLILISSIKTASHLFCPKEQNLSCPWRGSGCSPVDDQLFLVPDIPD